MFNFYKDWKICCIFYELLWVRLRLRTYNSKVFQKQNCVGALKCDHSMGNWDLGPKIWFLNNLFIVEYGIAISLYMNVCISFYSVGNKKQICIMYAFSIAIGRVEGEQ